MSEAPLFLLIAFTICCQQLFGLQHALVQLQTRDMGLFIGHS